MFKAEFVPRVVGEHRVSVTVEGQPTVGSPYSAKVSEIGPASCTYPPRSFAKNGNGLQGVIGKSYGVAIAV